MSIASITKEYIDSTPSIKDCVVKGLINYSALSREICEKNKINNFDAVLIACRRYYYSLKEKEVHQDKIIDLLKNVKLHVRNKMLVAVIDKPYDMEPVYNLQKKIRRKKDDFNLIEGEDVINIITNNKYSEEISELFKHKINVLNKDLVQITMIFPPEIETTHGVVSYIYSLLSEKGINIYEEMSCWTDLMIIISEKDLSDAINILS